MYWPGQYRGGLVAALCGLLTIVHAGVMLTCNQADDDKRTIYDFSVMNVYKDRTISLSDYKGKVIPVP
ncbi:glutathione peroxidase isoform X1 [Biomphalaria glabrata]|nr:glutathione peroxidase isoform X1 [Biomphalaria glabrata]